MLSCMFQCYLPRSEHRSYLAHLVGSCHWAALYFTFVVCNSLQALPHPTSVGASVVRFDLSLILTLCLFDGSSEGIAGFLISDCITYMQSCMQSEFTINTLHPIEKLDYSNWIQNSIIDKLDSVYEDHTG